MQVAHMTTGWHEGGYTYRLCPLGANGTLGLTEECFQKNILAFATDSTLLRKPGQENIGHWKEYKKVFVKYSRDSIILNWFTGVRLTSVLGPTPPAACGGR